MDNLKQPIELAEEILAQEERNKAALAVLLDKQLTKANKILVHKTEMGGTEAYVGSVTLEWLAERVRMASEMPLLRDRIDPETNRIEIDKSTVDLIQQRPLDWSRQAPLAQYLAIRKNHKFPPVLVVITKSWVDQTTADEWGSDGRAVRSAVQFDPIDSRGQVGLLDVSDDFTIFALDGQHRLMGIQGLMTLVKTGSLRKKSKAGQDEKEPSITSDDIINKFNISRSYIQKLPSEKIGVEFLSAVVAGETREKARMRIRSVFVHVNRMAVPLTKGQLDLLNEDNGFSIVARRTAIEHPFLSEAKKRVEFDSSSISERSSALTTLHTLVEMATAYMHRDRRFNWNISDKGLIPLRPEDEELESGVTVFKTLWDFLAHIPAYEDLNRGENTKHFRNFTKEDKNGLGHMLFRPVGQEALAEALGQLVYVHNVSLEEVFKKITKYDREGGFKMEPQSSVWHMVLYDPSRQRMMVRGKTLAVRLLVYLLGEGIAEPKERGKLRDDFAEARTVTRGAVFNKELGKYEGQALNFSGKFVDPSKIELPLIVRA